MLRASPKFWIPLIAVYSGMRLNEICQLTRSHIKKHEGIDAHKCVKAKS